jgi:hypothetical protein
VLCKNHERLELGRVLTQLDIEKLYTIWQKYQDDLTCPWYSSKPEFDDCDFKAYKAIASTVVKAMEVAYGEPLVLDQATISSVNHIGHPPHADNVQFDSVWWHGRQIKQRDELEAAREGASVLWKLSKTSYRNYSATVSLTMPSEYCGGDLEFYDTWGQREPVMRKRYPLGSGVAFCGCSKNIHAVTAVRWGFRLNLLVWTRPPGVEVPEDQRHVCYFRPGTGLSVWLTTAELMQHSCDMDHASMSSSSSSSSSNGGERPWRALKEDDMEGDQCQKQKWREEEKESESFHDLQEKHAHQGYSTWNDSWYWRSGWNWWQPTHK